MRRAAHAAAFAGALVAAGCAVARPGGSRSSSAPREIEPGCVARGVHSATVERPVAARATFEFWVEADGSPGSIEGVTWDEGLGLDESTALTNEVARALTRCRFIPATVSGTPSRVIVRLPLRFAPPDEASPETGKAPGTPEVIRPAREVVPGCVPRALPLPPGASAGAAATATFLVRVEADGSRGPVALAGRPDLDAASRRALVEEVAAAVDRCRFAPGTVNGEPVRTFWLAEVSFGAAP